MAAVAALNAATQLDQILVRIDDAPLDGLGGPRIVAAVVESHPASAKLVASLNLRPSHTGSHSGQPLPGESPESPAEYHPPFEPVKEGVLHGGHN
jgi:hypothetical protein